MKPSILLRTSKQFYLLLVFISVSIFSKAQAPLNDNPAGALFPAFTLTPAAACANTNGTMVNATITPEVANATLLSGNISPFFCTSNAFRFDVFYSFTATSSNHTITLSDNGGANFNRRQLVVYQANTLTTLSAVTCTAVQAGTGNLVLAFTDYSPGTTYFIRVIHSSVANTAITTNGGFRICVTTGTNNNVPTVQTGKSYTNISRPAGGTIQNGDVLEFRSAISVVRNGGPGALYNVSYHDTIPLGLSYVANSIKFESNEGFPIESGITASTTLTDASGDDEAVASGGVLRVNVVTLPRFGDQAAAANRQWVHQGSPATTPISYASAGGGKVHSQGRPNQFNGYSIVVVRYQTTVTAATGTTFTTSNGAFRYKTTTSSFNDVAFPQTIVNFPRYTVYVSEAGTTSCQGVAGTNVYAGGDFGSGNTKHDSTQLTIAPGYTWAPFTTGAPGDGFFAVVNNSSANNSTNKYVALPDATNRVFGVWDIIGDHTAASNLDSGNFAVPRGTTGGYMGVVNAAYGINTAIQKTINGLCTDTYYEFSAWFKNVCAGCSNDTAGRGMSNALFKPYIPLASRIQNDSAGVSPDLTYTIDGVDYYSTGQVIYDKKWIKKGFLFKTGLSQTSVTLTIRNNAPGGGGNDWAIDDIELTTCFPTMTYSPSSAPNICEGNPLTITDTVRYLYNNYREYKWQKWSVATSGPWTDIAGASGTGFPVWNGTQYEFVATYTIPGTATAGSNDGDLYRLIVASNTTNLTSSTCSYSDPVTINLNVLIDCGPPLKVDLLSATGRLTDNIAKISWVTSKEDEPVNYSVERSDDGVNFRTIVLINGYNNIRAETNNYSYTDQVPVTEKVYYRVVMIRSNNTKKYSSIIQLTPTVKNGFYFGTVVNPFNNEVRYEINSPVKDLMKIELIDAYGKIVKSEIQQIFSGTNSLSIYNTGTLSGGIYILKASINGTIIYRKIMKEKK